MENIKDFWNNYKGAIIGVIISIIIIMTKLYMLIVSIVLIVLGAIVGNYIQQNKEEVKDKLKKFIDRVQEGIKLEMKRSEIRELTFRLIYSLEIQKDADIQEQLDLYIDSSDIKEEKDREYITNCILGIKSNEADIIKEIEENITSEWKIERVSKVSISLLKLAIYEIRYSKIPFKAEINEVVELSKKYGDEKSGKFINGVLAKVVKDM